MADEWSGYSIRAYLGERSIRVYHSFEAFL